jgi:hypothetical protein
MKTTGLNKMQNFTHEDIGYVRAYLQRSPSDSLKKEADQVIGFLQNQVEFLKQENEELVRSSDARTQSLADQLAEAQQKCNDYMLKAKV